MQFIGDMLAFHTVRSGGGGVELELGLEARLLCVVKAKKKVAGAECGGKARTCAK